MIPADPILTPPSPAHGPLSSDLRPLSSDLRPLSSDLCPPTSDFHPPPTAHRPLSSDLCPLTSDLRPLSSASGFSLIELIAVVAILAILAAAILPAWIKRIDIATRNREAVNLTVISNSLVSSVLQTRTIPGDATWSNVVADYAMLPVSQVNRNSRRYQRLLFRRQDASLTLPFTQDRFGVASPQNMRLVIASQLGGVAFAASGGSVSDAAFQALWNAPADAKPTSGGWESWSGRADDLLLQRIDLAPLFHRLTLVNRDADYKASYRIDDSAALQLANSMGGGLVDAFFLDGTVVKLCDAGGNVMTPYVLTRDITFVFESGLWRAQIMGGRENNGAADDFANQAARFLASAWYTGSKGGADQQSALVAMYSFMLTYTFWANLCPHFPKRTTAAGQVPEYVLLQDFGDLGGHLDDITGLLGLLNKLPGGGKP